MRLKIIVISIIAIFAFSAGASVFAADEIEITSGAYYQLGKYNGSPIIWRAVVSDDENGVLMVSDKILCYRIFDPANEDGFVSNNGVTTKGTNHWENTAMRVWLNSTANSGEVEWIDGHIPSENRVFKRPYYEKGDYPYDDEKGFLNNDNFTESEKSVIKTQPLAGIIGRNGVFI